MDKFGKILLLMAVIVFGLIAAVRIIYFDEIKEAADKSVKKTLEHTEDVVEKYLNKVGEAISKSLEGADESVKETLESAKEKVENISK